MDWDSSVIHMPEIEPTVLLNGLNMNCKAAEDLAIETVTSSDAPFISAFRELTRGDCWQIMRKHQEIFNILEQAVVLSGLTDYITCAFQNELFDTFRKKHDRENFPAMLIHLNGKWMRFFRNLRHYDLTYDQLNSIMFLLRHSLKRLPDSYRRCFISEALTVGETFLERARLRPATDDVFMEPKQKKKSQDCKSSNHKTDSVSLIKKTKSQDCTSSNHKTNSVSLIKKTKIIVIPTLVKLSDNSREANTNPLPNNKSCKDMKAKVTVVESKPVKRTLDFIQPPIVDLSVDKPKKVQKKKYISDITKYILKASENREKTPIQTTGNISSIQGKENLQASKSTGSEIDIKLKEPVTHATPTGKLSSVDKVESPAKKKLCLEDNKSGRVNAFEVMMKQSRANKGQNIKRKSLFQ